MEQLSIGIQKGERMSRDKRPSYMGGCVGICSSCLRFLDDSGDDSHAVTCPGCMAEVVMTPREKIESGLREVAELLEKMQPCSIFHDRAVQPWPVLTQGLWHIDLRPGNFGPYAHLAAQWFAHEYQSKIERIFDAVIPDVGYIGDHLEESLVIPQDEIAQPDLRALACSLQASRLAVGRMEPGEWMREMEEWLGEKPVADLADLRRRLQRQRPLGSREQELLQLTQSTLRAKRGKNTVALFRQQRSGSGD
jgi:hypothetical protein